MQADPTERPTTAARPAERPERPSAPPRATQEAASPDAGPMLEAGAAALLQPRAWLSVSQGLHRGAEVAIFDGQCRIGATLDDDIVLRDAGIVGGHLTLQVDAEAVLLRAAAPGWLLDDAAIDPDSARHWVSRQAAVVALAPALRCGTAVLHIRWADADTARKDQAGPARRWTDWRRLLPLAMACAGLLVATLVIVIPARRAGSPPTAPQFVSGDALQAATRRLQSRGEWKHVAIARGHGTQMELRGRVERREELSQLLRAPEVMALMPAVRVLVDQDLRRQIHEMTGDGALEISFEDVAGPEGGASRQRVIVSGSTQRPGVAASLRLLNKELGERVEIVDRTLYAPDEKDRKTVRVELPIRIAAVNATEGYVEASNGVRYFEGSAVGNGHVIESIGMDKVVFNVSGRRVEFIVP